PERFADRRVNARAPTNCIHGLPGHLEAEPKPGFVARAPRFTRLRNTVDPHRTSCAQSSSDGDPTYSDERHDKARVQFPVHISILIGALPWATVGQRQPR